MLVRTKKYRCDRLVRSRSHGDALAVTSSTGRHDDSIAAFATSSHVHTRVPMSTRTSGDTNGKRTTDSSEILMVVNTLALTPHTTWKRRVPLQKMSSISK